MILIPNLKKEYQQKSKQTTTKNKNKKKTRVFFLQHAWGWSIFFNVRLFMKESALFTRDEPKASKGMQALHPTTTL